MVVLIVLSHQLCVLIYACEYHSLFGTGRRPCRFVNNICICIVNITIESLFQWKLSDWNV